eukprot:11922888-Heterocapsa_arctica.AAC.1
MAHSLASGTPCSRWASVLVVLLLRGNVASDRCLLRLIPSTTFSQHGIVVLILRPDEVHSSCVLMWRSQPSQYVKSFGWCSRFSRDAAIRVALKLMMPSCRCQKSVLPIKGPPSRILLVISARWARGLALSRKALSTSNGC